MSRRRWNTSEPQGPARRIVAADPEEEGRKRLFIVLPAYNEADVIRPLLLSIGRVIAKECFEPLIVLVDDGSRDRTVTEAEAAAADWDRIRTSRDGYGPLPLTILHHEFNRGLGAALRTGFTWCLQDAADRDVIVTLDADNTHPPRLIAELAHSLDAGFDIAIASRYRRGARVQGVPAYRRVLSDGGRFLMQALFPMRGVRDYTCCFGAYRASLLRRAKALHGDALCSSPGFEAVMDLLLQLRPLRPRCVELPLDLDYSSRVGRSKMDVVTNVRRTLALVARRFTGATPAAAPAPATARAAVPLPLPAARQLEGAAVAAVQYATVRGDADGRETASSATAGPGPAPGPSGLRRPR